jgi:hypothetical protein
MKVGKESPEGALINETECLGEMHIRKRHRQVSKGAYVVLRYDKLNNVVEKALC